MVYKLLDALSETDQIRYEQKIWVVTLQEIFRESGEYREVQWTLENDKGDQCYLVKSEKRKSSGIESVWVMTQACDISHIQYESAGSWVPFEEDNFVSSPPSEIKFDNRSYSFEGETSVKAKDDDGNYVPKLTWDYYDSSRVKNLAIEIWKESDRDYPEPYDGTVIAESDIEVLPPDLEVSRRIKTKPNQLNRAILGYAFVVIWFLMAGGIAIDAIGAITVPVMTLVIMGQRSWEKWICIGSLIIWILMSLILFLAHVSISFWLIMALGIGVILIVSKFLSMNTQASEKRTYSTLAISGFFPVVWSYSLWLYFFKAPAPHLGGQYITAVLLPVIASGLAYVIVKIAEPFLNE